MKLSEWANKHKELHFVVKGNPITKKNSSRIIKNKNRMMIIPSKQYKDYEKNFIQECIASGFWNRHINTPYNFEYHYYMETKRKVDLTNLISATDDCLQAAGVIDDDDCTIVHSHDGCRVFYDKENPRTEIFISDINEDEIIFPNVAEDI